MEAEERKTHSYRRRSIRQSFLRPFFLALGVTTTALILFGLFLLWSTPESMRFCLPFSLSRISSSARSRLSCQAHTSANITTTTSSKMGSGSFGSVGLDGFLRVQRDSFLRDLKDDKAQGWVVAMGNEAGDLDSIASSISLAYLSTTFSSKQYVPLLLTPSSQMHLRPENLHALSLAHIDPTSLFHIDQLPIPTSSLVSKGIKFGLVDHNRLLPQFGPGQAGEVEVVIDHHEDEGAHQDALLRIVKTPVGSCTSLVTQVWKDQWEKSARLVVPDDLATLLLSAILIDTNALKKGGKAMPDDYAAAEFLFPRSTWGQASKDQIIIFGNGDSVPPVLKTAEKELDDLKSDVSRLSSQDLLLRDYKEYVFATSSSTIPSLRVGLSTVPEGLKNWSESKSLTVDAFLDEVAKFMEARQSDIEGVLTAYKKKGEKHRELVVVVRQGGAIKTEEEAERVMKDIATGMETSTHGPSEGVPPLALMPWTSKKGGLRAALGSAATTGNGKTWNDGLWKAWEQNPEATRKQVQPVLKEVVANLK